MSSSLDSINLMIFAYHFDDYCADRIPSLTSFCQMSQLLGSDNATYARLLQNVLQFHFDGCPRGHVLCLSQCLYCHSVEAIKADNARKILYNIVANTSLVFT